MATENKRSTLNTTSNSVVQDYKDAIAAQSKADQGLGGWWQGAEKITDDIIVTEELRRKEEEARRKELQDQFDLKAEKISENMGGLGTDVFNIAYNQAKVLQDEYAVAVRDNNKQLQGEIRSKLQMLSTQSGSLKANLLNARDHHGDESGNTLLSEGMSEEQTEMVIQMMGTDGMEYDAKEGWRWLKPPRAMTHEEYKKSRLDEGYSFLPKELYDEMLDSEKPQAKDSDRGYYTEVDLNDALVVREDAFVKEFMDSNNTLATNGELFAAGKSGGKKFDFLTQTITNKGKINKKNITSLMYDDIFGGDIGSKNTFVENLNSYLTGATYQSLGLDSETFEGIDGNGIIDAHELKLLKAAITNQPPNANYDYEKTQEILAEWMTMKQKKIHMGDVLIDEREFIWAKRDEGRHLEKYKRKNPNYGKPKRPTKKQSLEDFIKLGGCVGCMNQQNIVSNGKEGTEHMWINQDGNEVNFSTAGR